MCVCAVLQENKVCVCTCECVIFLKILKVGNDPNKISYQYIRVYNYTHIKQQ